MKMEEVANHRFKEKFLVFKMREKGKIKLFKLIYFPEDFHEIITLCEYYICECCMSCFVYGGSVYYKKTFCVVKCSVLKFELLIVEIFFFLFLVSEILFYGEIFYTLSYFYQHKKKTQRKFSTFDIRKTFSIVYKSCFSYRYIIGFSVTLEIRFWGLYFF